MTQPLPPEPIPNPPPPGPVLTITYDEASRLASLLNDVAETLGFYRDSVNDRVLLGKVSRCLQQGGTLRVQPPQPEPQP